MSESANTDDDFEKLWEEGFQVRIRTIRLRPEEFHRGIQRVVDASGTITTWDMDDAGCLGESERSWLFPTLEEATAAAARAFTFSAASDRHYGWWIMITRAEGAVDLRGIEQTTSKLVERIHAKMNVVEEE